jgi:CSLREA domain-containing protein
VFAVALALLCALAIPASAGAAELKVDSTGDETDADLLDPACLTAGGKCTLRAAIEQANESGEGEIVFAEEIFDGQMTGTIVLGKSLPPIAASSVQIDGQCERDGAFAPCVGIEAPASEAALVIDHGFGVEISGVAVGGAQTGVRIVNEAESARINGSWFGLGLDGSAAGVANGVFIEAESNAARIGGEADLARNVFAHVTGTALTVFGADRTKILGDYFGVEPNGVTTAANGEDIEIVSAPGFEAVDNQVGTAVSSEAAASAKCDRGCNLISGATSDGLDLQGDGGEETPARNTTIAGNYFGLDETGSAAVANAGASIRVGEAAQTIIGGHKAGEANRINGGAVGVLAGPAAANLIVRGNAIGVGASGSGPLAPPESGMSIDSAGLTSPGFEALISENEIFMADGVGIALHGLGASVFQNSVAGAEVGIGSDGTSEPWANFIADNAIRNSTLNGILVESNGNEVVGNEISGSGAAGVRVTGPLPYGSGGNLIGGDAPGDENLISGSGGGAIEIALPDARSNEVARNRGSGNGGPFIDLTVVEPKEPTYKVEPPPTLLSVSATAVSGKAEPSSRVRVFRKASAAPGELDSFLGETIAGPKGEWKVAFDAPLPGGTIVAASQTGEIRGSSELAAATTPAPPGGKAAAGPAPPSADTRPPAITMLKGPKGKTHKTTVSFKFAADESGARFECKLDNKKFKSCKSPRKYKHLKPGKHVFKVRAIDQAGNVGAAVKRKFTVVE